MKRFFFSALVYVVSTLLISGTAQASIWHTGDIFTSNSMYSNQVTHYSANGTYIDSFTVGGTGSDVRGMAFGNNGWMYAVRAVGSGLGVTVIDSSGALHGQYSAASYVTGNLTYGAIAIANDGKFYVASQDSLFAFTPGVSVGTAIYHNNQVFDVEVLPNGNLLALSAYGLDEITSTGTLVRHVATPWLVDARGLEYDAANNDIYISMLGYSGSFFRLMRLDGATGSIEASTNFWYGSDLLLTQDHQLLVGSRTLAPTFFDTDLHAVRTLGSQPQLFVSQYVQGAAVPEPGIAFLMIAGVLGLVFVRRRSARG